MTELAKQKKQRFAFLRGWIGARGLSFCLGAFSMLNWMLGLVASHFDANLWWLDLSVVPGFLRWLFIPVSAMILLWFSLIPTWRWTGKLRAFTALLASCAALMLAVVGMLNTEQYLEIHREQQIAGGWALPLSSLITVLLLWIAYRAYRNRRKARENLQSSTLRQLLGTSLAFFVLFPLAQMIFFGYTDYRRKADAILAFGAGVKADGSMSLALNDRTRTAVDLYEAGLAPRLIFSGGPGPGGQHEVLVMRAYALRRGVPPHAILLDKQGLNTWSSVENSLEILRKQGLVGSQEHKHGAPRVLAVSTFYHMPRIKMAFHRAGREVYTVPAEESRMLMRLPWYMAREVLAFWYYFLRYGWGW